MSPKHACHMVPFSTTPLSIPLARACIPIPLSSLYLMYTRLAEEVLVTNNCGGKSGLPEALGSKALMRFMIAW
ncbi:uncharacterized protein M421DRAFT_357946 [Didymella exigua CBS 183.55]|uniref:Uncharacterized protein n=1 Tax=Didymella exigua CBS 183.55 TaxID=1150837 RepID=A0A6A5RUB3_9PLEO|nr:uncharacterized protein M421DRAFT_357946 [Didymella exigua CBS 183.55]KAF1930744.1 hypothetical protein M421DRAFT_357946 [Didymella exigua CBS 183.55]